MSFFSPVERRGKGANKYALSDSSLPPVVVVGKDGDVFFSEGMSSVDDMLADGGFESAVGEAGVVVVLPPTFVSSSPSFAYVGVVAGNSISTCAGTMIHDAGSLNWQNFVFRVY